MSMTYRKPRTRLNPFSEPMKAWWVENYVIKHYVGEIQVNTDKQVGTFSPTPSSPVGQLLKSHNPRFFTHPDFKTLDALEAKYRDPTLSKSQRKRVVEELWPLVDRLIKERRIKGELGTPPMEAGGSLQEIRDTLVDMRASLNTLRFDLNNLRIQAREHGWTI